MKGISISTCFDYNIPIKDQFELIKNAGFSGVSIGGKYDHSNILTKEGQQLLLNLSKETGLFMDTLHGYDMDKEDTLEVNAKLVEAAKYLNIPVIVLHCSSFMIEVDNFEEKKKDILKKLPKFENLVKGTGIKFAFENVMPGITTELMEYILNNANPNYFGFCYDSSHDQIDGPRTFDLLSKFANRMLAIHLSDRIKEFVDHVTPGEGFINFQGITNILKEFEHEFSLMMEVEITHSKYKNIEEFLNITFESAKMLLNSINE